MPDAERRRVGCATMRAVWRRWAWWVLLLVAIPLSAHAQAEWPKIGDEIDGWRVQAIERGRHVVRLELESGRGRTVLEIRARAGGVPAWSTARHSLSAPLGAPGVPPPKSLMDAVLERLRAYEAKGGATLVDGEDEVAGSVPTTTAAEGPGGPRGPPVLDAGTVGFDWHAAGLPGQRPWSLRQRYPLPGWPLLCLLLGAGWIAVRRNRRGRARLERLGELVERQPWPWLAALLLGMAALRLPELDAPFTFDALTQRLFFGSLDLQDIIAHRYADQRHPQLYYLILHGFLRFGHDEAVARLPALLFSLAAAATLFVLARPALGAVGALCATALLGLNVSFLTFSREVGDLTLFSFLTLLSTVLLLRAYERPTRRAAIAFAVAEAAMLYAYYLAPLVVGAHLLMLLVRGRSERRRPLWLGLGAAVLAGVPALSDLAELALADRGMREVARAFPRHVWGERSILELWAQLGAHLAPSLELLVLITVLGGLGVCRLARRPWRDPRTLVVSLIVVSATLIVGLAVPLVRLKPYYLLFVLPFLLVLVVAGCVGRRRAATQPAVEGATGRRRPWHADLRAGSAVTLSSLLLGGYAADLAMRLEVTWMPRNPPRFGDLGERIRSVPGPRIVIADSNAMHTILLYYVFPEPLEMYRTCFIADEGGGTQCHRGEDHLITLTLLPHMAAGWDRQSAARFEHARRLGPSWVVYDDHFRNPRLLALLREECSLDGAFGDYGAVRLFRCPAPDVPR